MLFVIIFFPFATATLHKFFKNSEFKHIRNHWEFRSEERDCEENMKKKEIVFRMNLTIWECDYHE